VVPERSFADSAHRRAFGDRVQRLRTERGWTQEDLAEAADLHRTYITAVERGQRNISLDAIDKLARGFGISFEELFRGVRT
jgi:transcriptional regulator with XRE-family HTH domain